MIALAEAHKEIVLSRNSFLLPMLLVSLGLTGVAEAQNTESAVYRVRFQAAWSSNTHPGNFPSNPHFSPLIGGVHSDAVSFWREGGIATAGIEAMAETGATSPLDSEVQSAVDLGQARAVLRGGGIAVSPNGVSMNLTVTRDFPLVTLVSMVAPSPDWFVGVSGLSMVENGDWLNQKVVTLYAWDAGSDNGTTYRSNNSDTNPKAPIALVTYPNLANGTPVGTFTFTRQDDFEPPSMNLNGDRFKVSLEWMNEELTRGNGMPVTLTDDTGYFWFFNESNVEAVVKVLNGCNINGHFWVFAGGLTNVEAELRVEDTQTGQVSVYNNNLNNPFQPIQDTTAFATCP